MKILSPISIFISILFLSVVFVQPIDSKFVFAGFVDGNDTAAPAEPGRPDGNTVVDACAPVLSCTGREGDNCVWVDPCPTTTQTVINGLCSVTHYMCTAGTSANNTQNSTTWSWSCNGSGGGTSASCTETKPLVLRVYAGPDVTVQQPDTSMTVAGAVVDLVPEGSSTGSDSLGSTVQTTANTSTQTTSQTTTDTSTQATNTTIPATSDTTTQTTSQTTADTSTQTTTLTPTNTKPTASAGNDITITLPTNMATVSGSSASDSDGDTLSYSWTNIAKPSGAPSDVYVNRNTLVPSFGNLSVAGAYTFQLSVSDGSLIAFDNMVVTVNPGTSGVSTASTAAPTANAGVDQWCLSGAWTGAYTYTNTTSMYVSGAQASGSGITSKWSIIKPPTLPAGAAWSPSFTLSNDSKLYTSITNLSPNDIYDVDPGYPYGDITGRHSLRLTVTDDQGRIATDDKIMQYIAVSIYSHPGGATCGTGTWGS